MLRFSQRKGLTDVRKTVQIDSIDEALRTSLWNVILDYLPETRYVRQGILDEARWSVWRSAWRDFLKLPMDEMPDSDSAFAVWLKARFLKWEWHEVFDLVECLAQHSGDLDMKGFSERCNIVLEREISAYRIVGGEVVQMTAEPEITEVEEAVRIGDKFAVVGTHLETALRLLADRQNPYYRDSIKESISAVESMCSLIAGIDKASLGNALAIIKKGKQLHPSLLAAFDKLYGYTSDADGIRHALLDDGQKLTFEDAKFMLVACSAFVNYLKATFT